MKHRAAIDPVTLALLAALALAAAFASPSGGPGKKHFWEFWKKDPVQQAQVTQAALDAERAKQEAAIAAAKANADAAVAQAKANVEAENKKQLGVSQEAVIATGAAITEAQAKTAAGALPVKELETAKTLNATAKNGLDQALGAAAPERIRQLEQMVNDLNNDRAAGRGALSAMQGALDASVRRESELRAQQAAIEAKAKADVAAAESSAKTAIEEKNRIARAAAAKEGAWALERDGLAREYERLTFWGKLGGTIFALVVLYVAYLLWRTGKLGNFAKDAVGMTEMLKGELKTRASAEEYAGIKEKIRADWMTAHDGTSALVEKLKSQLRL